MWFLLKNFREEYSRAYRTSLFPLAPLSGRLFTEDTTIARVFLYLCFAIYERTSNIRPWYASTLLSLSGPYLPLFFAPLRPNLPTFVYTPREVVASLLRSECKSPWIHSSVLHPPFTLRESEFQPRNAAELINSPYRVLFREFGAVRSEIDLVRESWEGF